MKISCLIVDDEQCAVDILAYYVHQIPYLNLVFSTTDSLNALRFIEENIVDLVISDLQMPKLSGTELYEKIHEKCKVIFVSGYEKEVIKSLGKNAVDFLMKPIGFERFELAIQKVFLLNPEKIENRNKLEKLQVLKKLSLLSAREKEILKLIGQMKENKDISELLFISLKTVETHRLNINQKLGSLRRKDLLIFALECKEYL